MVFLKCFRNQFPQSGWKTDLFGKGGQLRGWLVKKWFSWKKKFLYWDNFVILNCKGTAENKNSSRIETNKVQPTVHYMHTIRHATKILLREGILTPKLKVVYSISQTRVRGQSPQLLNDFCNFSKIKAILTPFDESFERISYILKFWHLARLMNHLKELVTKILNPFDIVKLLSPFTSSHYFPMKHV